jgi:TRAP-type C4-dicarboxylate transport system permease small subunit
VGHARHAGNDNENTSMKSLLDRFHRLLTVLMACAVALLIVPVTLQIISRYTALIPSYIWTEELSRFLFIWMVMLGAMIGVREGTHFDIDLWPDVSPRTAAILRIVANTFVLIFALVFAWWGIKFVKFGWNQTSELADLPMPFIFLAWPIAGFTWLVFLGESFVKAVRALRQPGEA